MKMNRLTVFLNNNKFIFFILTLGIIYKIILTYNGNFLFNMDTARDLVDVREMVELKKVRLTGPSSAIEGLFNGPAWYYLLAIPYFISSGNPYSTIILQFILWAVGGYFLLKLVSSFHKSLIIPVGLLWISSDYVTLTTVYAFNPNPVTHLTPLLIYLIYKYLNTNKLGYSVCLFFLGGLFFNFEMNFGIFIPLIIFAAILFSNKLDLLKARNFWIGSVFFALWLTPQAIFDLRHNFIMTNSVINFLTQGEKSGFDFALRLNNISISFFNVLTATLMNHKTFTLILIAFFIVAIINLFKKRERNLLVIISLTFIFIPFVSYIFIPVSVNPWHLGGFAAASILLVGYLLHELWKYSFLGKIYSIVFTFFLLLFSFSNIVNFFVKDFNRSNTDPSSYKSETAAIDYVYKKANGENFKVFTYLPSVIDYPYQYLFWWYGKKEYGYIPYEYAYSPNKPQYISNKDKFEGQKENYKGLVFLIKEPDRIGYRTSWENDYQNMQFISKEMVGPLEIEIRKEF